MDSYKKLIVWQDSRLLNKEIYMLVSKFPRSETYALSDQLRRACVSITSNIAEGYGQGSLKNRLRFLYMARGSLYEVETQLIVACDLEFLSETEIQMAMTIQARIGKMLSGLIQFTEDRMKNGSMQLGEEPEIYGNSFADI